MNFDVFVSYSHQDKAVADAACARLEAEGIRCWIAPRDVPPGADWAGSIIEAIENCRAMVVVFSSHANGSRQVHREVQHGFDREKPVVPLRIESVAPEKALSYYMQSIHWLDALTPPIEAHLDKLADTVRALLPARQDGESKGIPHSAGAARVLPGQPDATASESLDLQIALQKNNVFSAGLLFLLLAIFFTILALYFIFAQNDGAALASFAAGLPFLFLAYNIVTGSQKFRVAGAIVLALLVAAIFVALIVPAALVSVKLDHNALLFLGVFGALTAASMLAGPQPRSDKAALYTLRVLSYFVRRRAWVFVVTVLYAIPTWILFYQLTESSVWLVGLMLGQAGAVATMIAAHRQFLGFARGGRERLPKLP